MLANYKLQITNHKLQITNTILNGDDYFEKAFDFFCFDYFTYD